MFEIGFPELILIAIVGLLVIGPERLPEALRTLGLWIGRLRRSFTSVKTEIEREIGMDEIRRQLHNEAVMEEMRRIQRDVNHSIDPPDRRPRPADGNAPADRSAPAADGDVPADDHAPPDGNAPAADDPAAAEAAEPDPRSHADAGADEPAGPPPAPNRDDSRHG